jgi:uncharacterized YccA/Bax inhibitor family protein
MALFQSSNPVLGDSILDKDYADVGAARMTVQGTINKTLMFLFTTIIAGSIGWSLAAKGAISTPVLIIGALGSMVLGFMTYRKPEIAKYTGFAYSGLFGIVVGAVSLMYEFAFPGIVIQALILTAGTASAMLFLYTSGIIKVTEKFRSIIIMATAGIMMFYFVAMLLSLMGIQIPLLHSNGPMGIIFSLAVTVLAALNLLLDFDFIEKGSAQGLPKHMEWYGAFGLIVTLVWLYLELLRLLSKLKD